MTIYRVSNTLIYQYTVLLRLERKNVSCTRRQIARSTAVAAAPALLAQVKRLACENRGVYWLVGDDDDLKSIMAGYYRYFTAGAE